MERETMQKRELSVIGIIVAIVVVAVVGFFVVSSMTKPRYDLTSTQAEVRLNSGKSIDSKVIKVKINKVENKTALGQNLQAGKHLNFYPVSQQYALKKGDTVLFKAKKAKSIFNSWLISGNVEK
ncbi:prophage Lp2 protein 7 [Oenococcus oeni ATCC BAA-1163]|uniref:Prophage Lp2 protein 7 n=1 Tax=Oenococcus oeni ATCC BAA-1163 TaxID=379360 RepID=A0NKE1_OENOE|nr:hypothetical protein [Oenococcus oeni]EAV38994.1 prophage Lp2 protein 7 [Oenococcus oeni ATCC BAA-1163]